MRRRAYAPVHCIEVLDDTGQHVSAGHDRSGHHQPGNYSMPLIRYKIGDMAVLGPEKCPCGNLFPTLKTVTGSFTDQLVLEGGTVVSGEIFIGILGIRCNKGHFKQFQVIQEDFRKISINVVLERSFDDADRRDVESNIRTVKGDCEITWHFLDEILTTKSGKYEFVKSWT